MSMLDGVIFDFNGTLFFDSDYHFEVFNQLKQELCGAPLTMKEMETTYAGKPNTEIFRIMSDGRLSYEECVQYSERKEAMYRDLVRKSDPHLCDGAEELFDLLKEKHIPFTIASASIKANIDFFVETFHLDKWIDPKSITYDDGSYIDKVDMFRHAEKNIHVKDNVLIFEDSLSGIQCASKAAEHLIVIDRDALREYYDQYPIIQAVQTLKEAIPTVIKLISED